MDYIHEYMQVCIVKVSWPTDRSMLPSSFSLTSNGAFPVYIYVYVCMYECTSAYVSKFVYTYMSKYEYMNVKECM